MDIGTVLSVAQTLFSALQCSELKEVLSILNYQSQLDDLQRTVRTIEAVLRDYEGKQELSYEAQNRIEELKDAVFEADDLFDRFVTLAEQKQLLQLEADGSVLKKVSYFFSRLKNPLILAHRMSRGVKKTKKKLDLITYNQQFMSKNIVLEPSKERSRETSSYVGEVEIIGREHDLEKIVGTLLDPNNQKKLSVISIVGIGGLGKTALAQLVYNDPRVTNAFQLKKWICVSDHDKELDVMNILCKILGGNLEGSTLDQVQSQLRAQLAGNKYLLILDDVWTERRDHWCELQNYLTGEIRGSWIVITARSQRTAAITNGLMHKLPDLSEKDSWHLFERTAFALDKPRPTDELVEIGQKIVDGCSGVPLAIKVLGSLLCDKDKSEWLLLQQNGLAKKTDYNDDIVSILKLSFHQLEAPLKNCFRYCALFPKDYVLQKEMLISLWMAQGYIVSDNNQSIYDVGEKYFSILLKRCFFQDIKENKIGEIKSCKIHDLMHDIALNVSGKEMCALDNNKDNVDYNVRHLSISNMSEYENYCSSGKTHIRSLSFYFTDDFHLLVGALVERFKCLRVLNLSDKRIKCLPNSIGELLHLRYIDLSKNKEMEVVPNSITKLCNLQTLILNDCRALKELPKNLCRLVKLRILDIEGCEELTSMPRGMGKLSSLYALRGVYKVGEGGRCTSWKQWLDELENLKTLDNLRGKLQIWIRLPKNAKNDVREDKREGLYLKSMENLSKLELFFEDLEADSGTMEDEQRIRRVAEDLQPHSSLKSLLVGGYNGVKIGWLTATKLPHLVKLVICECKKLKYLSCLRNLRRLKSLRLEELPMLEYIVEEEDSTMLASSSTTAQEASLFPSLEELRLVDLPKFEGWRRVGVGMEESAVNTSNNIKPQLQQLKHLVIGECPELTCILLCPKLETLLLRGFNERLQIICSTNTDGRLSEAVVEDRVPKLRLVHIDNVAWLKSMPMESFHTLQILDINNDEMINPTRLTES